MRTILKLAPLFGKFTTYLVKVKTHIFDKSEEIDSCLNCINAYLSYMYSC